MKPLTTYTLTAVAITVFAFPPATASAQSVLFDFRTPAGAGVDGADPAGTNFDPSGVDDTVTVGGLIATITDVTAPEFDVNGALTGVILSGATGGVTTNVSGQDALGIQNPSIGNAAFTAAGGNGTEASDLNPGESITFTFDQDVVFTEIELESVQPVDTFDVLVNGVTLLATTGDDSFLDDLGGLAGFAISAGSEITFAVDGTLGDTSVRLETFTVNVVPEPSSMALLMVGSGLIAFRRRA